MSYTALGWNRPLDLVQKHWYDQDYRLAIDHKFLTKSSALTISHVQLCPLERYIAYPTS